MTGAERDAEIRRLIIQKHDLEQDKKDAVADFNERIKAKDARLYELATMHLNPGLFDAESAPGYRGSAEVVVVDEADYEVEPSGLLESGEHIDPDTGEITEPDYVRTPCDICEGEGRKDGPLGTWEPCEACEGKGYTLIPLVGRSIDTGDDDSADVIDADTPVACGFCDWKGLGGDAERDDEGAYRCPECACDVEPIRPGDEASIEVLG